MQNRSLYILPIAALWILSSCKENDPVDTTAYDTSAILQNSADAIITATYADLHTNAVALLSAVESLQSDPTEIHLEAARVAWRNTRKPWEQSEGFLFGPVSTKGIDPAIDSWPVNTVDLDAVLNGTDNLTKSYIDGLEGTLKGFHTIEYLLWGVDGNKSVSDFSDREFEYLIGLCQSLEGETNELFTSWDLSGDNFQENISGAGMAGSIYPSQRAAMQELINGMIVIADEVANGKINDPYSTGDVTLEESRFSANSKADFADNIRSIKIYMQYL
ncbi:MAG: imelysin family protein [Chitinophagales bacterium]